MGSYTISFILLNTKHYQIMISDYVNNGQWINRNEFDKELSRKMREVLPSMLMKHDLLLSYNSLASHTCVYFDFSIKHKIIGRMVFRHLCYVGSKLTHVFPQYLIRGNAFINIFSLLLLLLFNLIGGDITNFDGSGGERIYAKTFADENFNNKHSKPGTLSMTNFGSNTNNSQFFITYIELPFFDDTYVVLGEISSGMDVMHAIMNQGSVTGRPKTDIMIVECGTTNEN
ncbi:unnamed protein product [Rotaria magnacalcarata]|uniref:Peptidyl-prolyl cis-trans isomerase n=2 Tax=Rotaria magnacalcarata TaxID=392030 RepID=A0A815CRN3_9BILA|nr:unnamed protein product [Rotaria magnacalcarata]